MSANIVILALGNRFCADDIVGIELLQYFTQHYELPKVLTCLEAGSNPLATYNQIADCNWLIILDAVSTASAKTALTVLDPFIIDDLDLSSNAKGISPHQLNIKDLLLLLQNLQQLPKRLSVIGIESQNFSRGEPPTETATKAIPKAAQSLAKLLTKHHILINKKGTKADNHA